MKDGDVFSEYKERLYTLCKNSTLSLCVFLSNSNYYDVDASNTTSIIYNRIMRVFFYLLRLKLFNEGKYEGNLNDLSKLYYECTDHYHKTSLRKLFELDDKEMNELHPYFDRLNPFIEFCDYLYMNGSKHNKVDFVTAPVLLTHHFFEEGGIEKFDDDITPKNTEEYTTLLKGVMSEITKNNFFGQVNKIVDEYVEAINGASKKVKTINIDDMLTKNDKAASGSDKELLDEPSFVSDTKKPNLSDEEKPNEEELAEIPIEDRFNEVSKQEGREIMHSYDSYILSQLKALMEKIGLSFSEDVYYLYGNLFKVISSLSKDKLDINRAAEVFCNVVNKSLDKEKFNKCKDQYDVADKIKSMVGHEKEFDFFSMDERDIVGYCIWHSVFNVLGKNEGKRMTGIYDFYDSSHIEELYSQFKKDAQEAYVNNHADEIKSYTTVFDNNDSYGYDPETPALANGIGDVERAIDMSTYNGEKAKVVNHSLLRNSKNRLIDKFELKTEKGNRIVLYCDLDNEERMKILPYGFNQIDEKVNKRPIVSSGGLSFTPVLNKNAWNERRRFVNELGQCITDNDKETYKTKLDNHIVEHQKDKEYVLDLYKEVENDLTNWLFDKDQALRILDFLISSDPRKKMTWGTEAEKLKARFLENYNKNLRKQKPSKSLFRGKWRK